MRSPRQLAYRLKQEVRNVRLWQAPPRATGAAATPPLAILPPPSQVRDSLAGTPFASGVVRRAEEVLGHRLELLGLTADFGPSPIRWRRDFKNGIELPARYFRRIPYLDRNLAGDHKLIWELNRHQHLVLLAQAFLFAGRPEFLEELQSQIETWWEQNPFQCGMNWTSALEVGFRALSWFWICHLVGGRLETGFRERLLESLLQHGSHIEANLSYYFSPNTHLLGEAVALHALGCLLSELPGASRWRDVGHRIVCDQMGRQVRDDGSHFERSTYYHVYALDMFLFHAVIAGMDETYREKLFLMAEFLNSVMGEDRLLPFFGDDDGGRFFHPYGSRAAFGRATLATCSVLLGRGGWPYSAADLHQQASWWIGVAEGCGNGHWAPRIFSDAGLAVMHVPGRHIVIDIGPFGPGRSAHSHSDTLSLTVRSAGEEILIDSGTYTYVGDPAWRNRFRGSEAHNTLRIDGRDQAIAAGPFAWSNPPAVIVHEWGEAFLDAAWQSHDGFSHRRRIHLVSPAELTIEDEAYGPGGEHTVEQFWHLGSAKMKDRFLLDGDPKMLEGWRSTAFGRKCPAPVMRISKRGLLPMRFLTRIRL